MSHSGFKSFKKKHLLSNRIIVQIPTCRAYVVCPGEVGQNFSKISVHFSQSAALRVQDAVGFFGMDDELANFRDRLIADVLQHVAPTILVNDSLSPSVKLLTINWRPGSTRRRRVF
jgi:hypothetical protein